MANKGQKFKKYTQAFINQVMVEQQQGASSRNLARKYQIPRGTILTWINRFKLNGNLTFRKRGRPTGDESSYKERYLILKKFQAFLTKHQLNKK
jgi:transposase